MNKLLFILLLMFALPVSAQESNTSDETNPNIKELSDYHDVIYPIWHTAYPSKDYAMLREMTPQVISGAERIYSVKLPGILREKEKKWNENVAGLKKAVEEYKSAAEGENDEALLTAAEVLHTYYELLVRSIRPVVKEVDDYHKVLYVIYHTYYPQKNYSRIKELTDDLITKATKVKESKLPARLKQRTEAYERASNSLYYSTLSLKEALYSNNSVLIDNAIEKMHSDYQRIEELFD